MLTISEKLMLLGLHDEKGSIIFTVSAQLPFGLAGALFYDLYYRGRISIRDDELIIRETESTGIKHLDKAFEVLRDLGSRKSVSQCVGKLVDNIESMKESITDSLIEKGILKKEKKNILWLIKVERFPTKDPREELNLRKKIKDTVLNDKLPDKELYTLITLIEACELIDEIFPQENRPEAYEKIAELTETGFIDQKMNLTEALMIKSISKVVKSVTSSTLN